MTHYTHDPKALTANFTVTAEFQKKYGLGQYMSINRLMQVNVEAPSEHVCSNNNNLNHNVCGFNRFALLYKD